MELYNTFLRRLGAAFVDGMILSVITSLPGWLGLEAGTAVSQAADFIAFFATAAYVVYLTYRYGGTVGKLAVGVKVTTADLEPISLQQSLIRESPIIFFNGIWLVLMLRYSAADGIAMVVMTLACIWWVADALSLLMNEKGRALHDFLAGTVVIRNVKLATP